MSADELELRRGLWELEVDGRLPGVWAELLEAEAAGALVLDIVGPALRAAFAIGYACGREDDSDELRARFLELVLGRAG